MKLGFGGRLVVFSALAVALSVAWLLHRDNGPRGTEPGTELLFYCAAGLKPPVEAAARQYEKDYKVKIQIQYGGSGTLLSNLSVARRGDLYLAADDSYMVGAREKGLVAETLPLATMRPVIAVKKGNPRNIHALADLARDDVITALANPDAAAIGRIIRACLQKTGDWDNIEKHTRVFKPTVTDVANDLRIGSVDAGIVWDATVAQYPELEAVDVPAFKEEEHQVDVGVLTSSTVPTAALRFARYLAARDRGLLEFKKSGYRPVDGDVWAETPDLVLFSGGVNRMAIEDTIQRFEAREGVRVTRVYNGCGILVSQMKAGQKTDGYFACDNPFMNSISNLMMDVQEVSSTDMVILAQKGNPRGIHALEDLVRPGLKIGLANEEQSALGARTRNLLNAVGIRDQVNSNVVIRTPTADLLVNQMLTGASDASIVYRANTSQVRDKLEIVPIPRPEARAVQPIGVSRESEHKYLMRRLKELLVSPESRRRFEELGFAWRYKTHE